MKKTYEVSTGAREWAKHLRPFGKRLANKSTRKIWRDRLKQIWKEMNGTETEEAELG